MNIEIIFHVGDMGHYFFVFVDAHDLQMLKQSMHGMHYTNHSAIVYSHSTMGLYFIDLRI